MDPILKAGVELILYLQSFGPGLAGLMRLFTYLGEEAFFLVLMPALYWCVDVRLGIRVAMVLLFSNGLNSALKLAFHAPRPFWYDPRVQPLRAEATFGIPSGHAQNTVSVFGAIAAWIGTGWIWVLTVAVVFLVGLSRLVLGMHFPTDVLAGWLIGAVLLWLILRLETPAAAWFRRQGMGGQAFAALGVSLLLLGIGLLARLSLGDWQAPAAWIQNAAQANLSGDPAFSLIDPLGISSLATAAGSLFGMLIGVSLIQRWGGFNARGGGWKIAARFVIGILGVLLIWQGLGVVLPRGETFLPLLLRYLRYALAGVWITALAPAIFKRLSLTVPA